MHNTRIESLWRHVNSLVLQTKELLLGLEREGIIDPLEPICLLVIQTFFKVYIYNSVLSTRFLILHPLDDIAP